MDDVDAMVRERLFDYVETTVLAEAVSPPADWE
jgi:hypothetical protein